MATQFEIDCALMAGRVYESTRTTDNLLPVPSGWTEFFHRPASVARMQYGVNFTFDYRLSP